MRTSERMYPYPKGWTTTPPVPEHRTDDYVPIDKLSLEDAKAILEAFPELATDQQNEAPTFAELIALAERWPGMTFHGYVIGPDRDDERISIEGFYHPKAKDVCKAESLTPDELSATRAWWD